MRNQLVILVIPVFFAAGLQAQQNVNASGTSNNGAGGSVSYSVGQVVYTTASGTNGSAIQGVQQPYEISVITSVGKATDINLSVLAYPNPTSGFLELKVDSNQWKDLNYQLFDVNGRLLIKEKITGSRTAIPMSRFIPATYILKVSQGNREIRIFKIIKN